MFINRKLYHLSHIDLDGYSCQLLTSYIFPNRQYYNANYGREILARIDEIFTDIDKEKKPQKVFILITDLNLSISEAKYIEDKKQNSRHNIHLQLLDHHITGLEVSEQFSWYYLNPTKSATLITYEYIQKNFPFKQDIEKIEKFVQAVNALDIWIQDDTENFEYGKVMMRLISSARELTKTLFPEQDTEYKLQLLKGAMDIYSNIEIEKKNIYLDDNIHKLKKEFFREKDDDTIDNLLTEYIVKLLSKHQDKFTIKYKGYKGLLTYMLGNTSIVGNGFLKQNPHFDFFLDISGKGNISIRANNKVDVSIIAKEIANGGGHMNASGGRIRNFREQFGYEKVKNFIQNILIEKEYTTNLLQKKS